LAPANGALAPPTAPATPPTLANHPRRADLALFLFFVSSDVVRVSFFLGLFSVRACIRFEFFFDQPIGARCSVISVQIVCLGRFACFCRVGPADIFCLVLFVILCSVFSRRPRRPPPPPPHTNPRTPTPPPPRLVFVFCVGLIVCIGLFFSFLVILYCFFLSHFCAVSFLVASALVLYSRQRDALRASF